MNRRDILALPDGKGSLVLCAFPTRESDLDDLAACDVGLLVSLTPTEEMTALGLPPALLAQLCQQRGMAHVHMPVGDMSVAGTQTLEIWAQTAPLAHALLDAGRAVALHCRMGLGRTGTLAGMLLVERGMTPGEAIAAIRRARPGSIETRRQEAVIEKWPGRR